MVTEAWPPHWPDAVRDWPVPRGQKRRPPHWIGGDAHHFRAHFETALLAQGEGALASVWNDASRGPLARPTRWFCSGVPMYATGRRAQVPTDRTLHEFLVPARAALLALEEGLVVCAALT